MEDAKKNEKLSGDYDLKNMTSFLEASGFEVFLTGPRYLPLTHGPGDAKERPFNADQRPFNAELQAVERRQGGVSAGAPSAEHDGLSGQELHRNQQRSSR